MQIEWVPIKQLIPNPKNPNSHSAEQIDRLAEIIKYQGWRHPIIVDKDMMIWAGHGRLLAAKKLKEEKIPIHIQEFQSPEQAYAFLVSDNAIASWAELDLTAINLELPELGPDFDINLLGIKGFEIEPADRGLGDEDEAPPVPEVAHCRVGDVFILGAHRLQCGDSTDVGSVARLMNGEKADMVFTDPPYNMASENDLVAASVSKAMKKLKASEWDKDFDPTEALDRIYEVLADDVTVYVCTSHHLAGRIWEWISNWPIRSSCSNYCVWAKPNPMPSLMKRHWTWSSELICYATRGKHTFNFPDSGHALNVWNITKHSDGTHPTQKPVELCEHAIQHSSAPDQTILDLFLGSGSTLIACQKTNRRCFGMEIDPHYCDVILDRWAKYTGKDPIREDGVPWSEIKNGQTTA